MKPAFLSIFLCILWVGAVARGANDNPEIPIGLFEGENLDSWTTDGDAFGAAPYRPGEIGRFDKFEGRGLAWSGRAGIEKTGTLLSSEFEIHRPYLNFLIAGTRYLPSKLGVELLIDGAVVRSNAASENADPTRALYWRTFDLRPFAGKKARLRVNDHSAAGAVAVDQFVQGQSIRGVCSDATKLFGETHRPGFHFTAETGWLNDANGLLHYRGQWHLFHQHVPPGSRPKVWGHAVSSDLVHWRHLATAIPADGINSHFSGSGLVDRENASGLKQGADDPLLLFYTLRPPGEVNVAEGKGEKATQCLAFSLDGGRTFRQFAGNPILRTADFHDRDPKVIRHEPSRAWIMLLSLSRNNTDREHATYGVFRSTDLTNWILTQEIGPGTWYWECPDFFELPLDGEAGRPKWILMKGSSDYIVGSFDGRRFEAETEIIRTRWGGSFYGAQTFSDAPGGRRIQIAWMSTGKSKAPNAYPGMPFNQQMSFPQELTLRSTPEGPRIFFRPAAEIEQLYAKTREIEPRLLAPGDNPLAGIDHDLLDIELEFELREAAEVNLILRGEKIRYETRTRMIHVSGRSISFPPRGGGLLLRILLDRTSFELYGNGGAFTHSDVFFSNPKNGELSLTVEGGPARLRRLTVHELKSIWPRDATEP